MLGRYVSKLLLSRLPAEIQLLGVRPKYNVREGKINRGKALDNSKQKQKTQTNERERRAKFQFQWGSHWGHCCQKGHDASSYSYPSRRSGLATGSDTRSKTHPARNEPSKREKSIAPPAGAAPPLTRGRAHVH